MCGECRDELRICLAKDEEADSEISKNKVKKVTSKKRKKSHSDREVQPSKKHQIDILTRNSENNLASTFTPTLELSTNQTLALNEVEF